MAFRGEPSTPPTPPRKIKTTNFYGNSTQFSLLQNDTQQFNENHQNVLRSHQNTRSSFKTIFHIKEEPIDPDFYEEPSQSGIPIDPDDSIQHPCDVEVQVVDNSDSPVLLPVLPMKSKSPSPTMENWNQVLEDKENILPAERASPILLEEHPITGKFAQIPLPPPELIIPKLGAITAPNLELTPPESRIGVKGPKTPPLPQVGSSFPMEEYLNPLYHFGSEGLKSIAQNDDGEKRLFELYRQKGLTLEQIRLLKQETIGLIEFLDKEIEERTSKGELPVPHDMNAIELWKHTNRLLKTQMKKKN